MAAGTEGAGTEGAGTESAVTKDTHCIIYMLYLESTPRWPQVQKVQAPQQQEQPPDSAWGTKCQPVSLGFPVGTIYCTRNLKRHYIFFIMYYDWYMLWATRSCRQKALPSRAGQDTIENNGRHGKDQWPLYHSPYLVWSRLPTDKDPPL